MICLHAAKDHLQVDKRSVFPWVNTVACFWGGSQSVAGTGKTGMVCLRRHRERGGVRVRSYVLLEDEAGQQGGGLLHRQVVEEAVEDHLCQQELVATGDGDTGRGSALRARS